MSLVCYKDTTYIRTEVSAKIVLGLKHVINALRNEPLEFTGIYIIFSNFDSQS